MDFKRITSDNPKGSLQTVFNNVYTKDKFPHFRIAGDVKDVPASKIIASFMKQDKKCHCSEKDLLNGNCVDCEGCVYGALYFACEQAALFRDRLMDFENDFAGFAPLLKLGDFVYEPTYRGTINTFKIVNIIKSEFGFYYKWTLVDGYYTSSVDGFSEAKIGETIFRTKKEAEEHSLKLSVIINKQSNK